MSSFTDRTGRISRTARGNRTRKRKAREEEKGRADGSRWHAKSYQTILGDKNVRFALLTKEGIKQTVDPIQAEGGRDDDNANEEQEDGGRWRKMEGDGRWRRRRGKKT